jgi:hypothetical protein
MTRIRRSQISDLSDPQNSETGNRQQATGNSQSGHGAGQSFDLDLPLPVARCLLPVACF